MISGRDLLVRLAPFLACLGLLTVWQAAALALNNDSFPTALGAIQAIPSILGDKDALINILAWRRRTFENAGDLSRRQPAGDLSQFRGRQGGRRKDAMVGRRDGALGGRA